jgi:hypothetical protein
MQFATSVSTPGFSGIALPRVLLALAVGGLLLVGSVPSVFATGSDDKGPDITGLNLDQYGADIADADESAQFQGRGQGITKQGPDITSLNLDQYGADIAGVDEPAQFQGRGEGVSTQGPDITTLNLDRYGADVPDSSEPASFQMHGDPTIVAGAGHYVAGPHDVSGGNEGKSEDAALTGR